MASSSQSRIEKTKRKPRVSERFGDNSRIHNKRGNGRQKHLKQGEESVNLYDYIV